MPAKHLPIWAWFAIGNFFVVAVAAIGLFYAGVFDWLIVGDTSAQPRVSTPVQPANERRLLSVGEVVQNVDSGLLLLNCKNSEGKEIAIGSGFVIDAAGLVATNFHVIRAASSIDAIDFDGTKYDVKGCRAWNEAADLAILELATKPAKMEVLKLSTETARPRATQVVAMGHPQGFRFVTTTGIISAVHKTSELPQPYRELIHAPDDHVWIQTNAAISGGNSGGPLLNLQGEVVGINTWVAAGQNLGFAADVRHLISLMKEQQATAIPLAELTGPHEQLAALVVSFNNQRQWMMQEVAKSWTQAAAKKLVDTRHPALEHLPKFVEFAEKNRGKPAAFSALTTVCEIAALPECPEACNETIQRATAQLLAEHRDDARMIPIALRLASSRLDAANQFLRQLSEKSSNRKLQATSLLAIALGLRARPEPKDREKRLEESLALLERLAKDFGDVELQGEKLADSLEGMIFEFKYLAIGKKAPDIEGSDHTGQTLRLSDFKGKVVVLDFWVDWCPHCVNMYPLERKLVVDYANKPFALVGVNCDQPARLKRVLDEKKVTWRSWADGPQGPIARQWHVQSFPTLYVLDHEGVIRYINVRDRELEAAIKELMAKVPNSGGPVELAGETKPTPPGTTPAAASPAATTPPTTPASATATVGSELRAWTSKDGRTAKFHFLGFDGQLVKLRREDGREFQSRLDAFSADDQKWVRSQPATN